MDIKWEKYIDKGFPKSLIVLTREFIERGASPVIDTEKFSQKLNISIGEINRFLILLKSDGILKKITRIQCPFCSQYLNYDEIIDNKCPVCSHDFSEIEFNNIAEELFIVLADPSRDIKWAIALHGMNTRGAWQEELSSEIATEYKYSAPFFIYKYGLIRPGVLLRFRQKQLVNKLIKRLKNISQQAKNKDFGDLPDIIAHSFGTWLLGHALFISDEIKVGRIILTGCILKPDFDWDSLIKSGKVEAVLNHFGTRDFPVRVSHYLIPDSGPSGSIGFLSTSVFNVPAKGYKHSTFFKSDNIKEQFSGLWLKFLTLPFESLKNSINDTRPEYNWKNAPLLFRELPRIFVLIIFTIFCILLCAATIIGLVELFVK